MPAVAPHSCSHPPRAGPRSLYKPHTSLPILCSPHNPPADFICLTVVIGPTLRCLHPPHPPQAGPGQASSSGSRAGAGDGRVSRLREPGGAWGPELEA